MRYFHHSRAITPCAYCVNRIIFRRQRHHITLSHDSWIYCGPGLGRPGPVLVAVIAAGLLPGQTQVAQPARVEVECVHAGVEQVLQPRTLGVGLGPANHPVHDGRVPGVQLGQLAARAGGLVVLGA